MQLTISKSDLVSQLIAVVAATERKTTIPVLEMVKLDAAGESVTLTATDLEVAIRTPCPAKVKTPGSCLIPARRLLEYVKLLPDADIDLSLGENQWVTLRCGRSRTRMAGMSVESFPEFPEVPQGMFSLTVGQFQALSRRTSYAISAEESRFTLNGCLMASSDDGIRMVATDGHRLALAEIDVVPPVSFRHLIPAKALSDFTKLVGSAGDAAEFWLSDDSNNLFFQVGERVMCCRKLSGIFPDYERVLPKGFESYFVVSRDEFCDALTRAKNFADARSSSVKIQVRDSEITVSSATFETGESEETLVAETCGEVLTAFNAKYLIDVLRTTDTPKVKVLFRDGQSAIQMEPLGQESNKTCCIVMPMKL